MIDAGLTDIEPREAKGQVVETRNAETMKNKGREIEIAMAEIWLVTILPLLRSFMQS
jgi:hypothetical protein